jgi:TPR repeat protein
VDYFIKKMNNWIKGAFGIGMATILSYGIYKLIGNISKVKIASPEAAKEFIKMNVELSNLWITKNWEAIIDQTKNSENLLAKTFLFDAYFNINQVEKSREVFEFIISQTPKDDYDEFAIGKTYNLGSYVDRAFEWIEKSASKKNPLALNLLKSLDKKKGIEYLKMASDLNEPISQYLYALYLRGSNEADTLLQKSCEWNYIPSLYAMGKKYMKSDPSLAAKYFKKCSDMNYSPGMVNFSHFLMNGLGVEEDQKTGIELLKKAVSLGDINAIYKLSTYYKSGFGVEKDEKKAFELCDKLEKKSPMINYLLSFYYMKGVGCEIDENKYMHYLNISAESRYPDAMYLLGTILSNKESKDAIQIGKNYLAEAAKMGHLGAISQQLNQGKEKKE